MKIQFIMKKYFLLVLILFTVNCKVSGYSNMEILSDFTFTWLEQHDPNDNAPWLHPYDPNVFNYQKTYELWDLNTDGIVNFLDYTILSNIDLIVIMEKLEQKYNHRLYGKSLEHLVYGPAIRDIEELIMIEILLLEFNGDEFEINKLQSIIDSREEWFDEELIRLEQD